MYNFEALAQDVAKQRSKLSKDGSAASTQVLSEAWSAFTRYLSAALNEKRGLHIPSFAKIGWLIEKQRVGPATYRPFFQVTDQFATTCSMPADVRKRICALPSGGAELCALEDFNYSKAAIKFSDKLTKDNVFTSMRDLLRRLAEVITEGSDIDISFGEVGRLECHRDREVRFHFAADLYTREGMEVPAGSFVSPTVPTSASFSRNAPKEAKDLAVVAGGSASVPLEPVQEVLHTDNFWAADADALGDIPPPSRRSLASSGSTPSLSGAAPNLTNQQYKREVAYKQAMDRHISEMEAKATEAIQERESWSQHVNDCLAQERDDIQMKRERAKMNLMFLQQQMDMGEQRRKEQRKEDIVAASTHEFPKVGGEADDEDTKKDFLEGQRARMRAELDEQVRTNNTLRNLHKQRERALEVNQLESNRKEMSLLRSAERAKKAYDREALATAWNSDIRMKNVWKAIESHNKVGSHMPQILSTDSLPPSRAGSTVSAGRLMTGSRRRAPLGASSSLARLQGN